MDDVGFGRSEELAAPACDATEKKIAASSMVEFGWGETMTRRLPHWNRSSETRLLVAALQQIGVLVGHGGSVKWFGRGR